MGDLEEIDKTVAELDADADKAGDKRAETDKPAPTPGALNDGEPHPAAHGALSYVKRWLTGDFQRVARLQEALASTALSGNRNAEICSETLNRIMNGVDVSDRYVLGLAWTMRNLEELEGSAPPVVSKRSLIQDVKPMSEAIKDTAHLQK